jgi:indole-3-glycerol phosphate synthase
VNSILTEIVENKKVEVGENKKNIRLEILKEKIKTLPKTRGFKKALSLKKFSIIAEVKKASPSKGIIREDFDPVRIAKIYEKGKVDAISVLTDNKYFKGDILYLKSIKKAVSLPILRKDFIIDEYQIYESRYYYADAILLIVAILSEKKLKHFIELARKLNLDCLVEVHSKSEIQKAIKCNAEIIGINNRDLNTFKTDLRTTENLIKYIPKDKIVVSESGINKKSDVEYLKNLGVNAVLVGEAFMKSRNILKVIKRLF